MFFLNFSHLPFVNINTLQDPLFLFLSAEVNLHFQSQFRDDFFFFSFQYQKKILTKGRKFYQDSHKKRNEHEMYVMKGQRNFAFLDFFFLSPFTKIIMILLSFMATFDPHHNVK